MVTNTLPRDGKYFHVFLQALKKRWSRQWCLVGLSIALLIPTFFLASHRHAHAQDLSVQQWNPVEIQLTSSVSYTTPYTDVDVSATFSGPGGITMTMPGFWDGGSTWRIRFAPPLAGAWTYTTTSTDSNNSGLNNQAGSITVTSYTGTNPLYQHGWALKASSNNRYLTYADGTPFYWLGDTHWLGLVGQEHLYDTNDSSFGPSQFKGMVDRRAVQGFTVYQFHTFANNGGSCNEGGCAWDNNDTFHQLNPGFWQNIDQRIQYVAGDGLLTNLSQGVGSSLTATSGIPDHERLARYLVARYGAYPVIWLNAQEYSATGCGSCWGTVAAYVYSIDPYQRADSLHDQCSCIGQTFDFRDQNWYSHDSMQAGHFSIPNVSNWLTQYNATPTKPILEDECQYENISGHTDPGLPRQCAWLAQMGGSFGFTYGAEGVWNACWDASDTSPNCANYGAIPWNTAINFPGGQQMSYMQNFFTSLPWWTLAPDGNAITWNGAPGSDSAQQPYQKTNNDHTLVVAYLPSTGSTYSGIVNNLSTSTTYNACWFDPQQGTYLGIQADFTPDGSGQWSIPPQPNGKDWVLLLQHASCSTPNLALHRGYSSSSDYNSSQTADKAFDGDYGTNWQAASGRFGGEWLAVNFGTSTTFNQVKLTEYGHRTAGFQIQYWDGSNWQTAYTGTSIGDTEVTTAFTFPAVTGSQARILFTSGSYQPIIYEFEVYNVLPGGSSSFTTSISALGGLRNDVNTVVGMVFTVGSTPINITALGRYHVAGNSGTHTLEIIRASDGTVVGSASVDMSTGSSDALGFRYASFSTPITLQAQTTYYEVSSETQGGDQWYDNVNTTLTTTNAASITGSVYSNGSSWTTNGSPGNSYGPLNFLYQ